MVRFYLIVIVILLFFPSIAFGLEIKNVTVVSSVNKANTATEKHKYVKNADSVKLFCVVKATVDGATIVFTTAGKVKGISTKNAKTWDRNVIKYGKKGIKEGDIIFFCYSPDTAKKKCKRWHHVGAIYEDSGPDGKPDKILNGDDIILHAGPREPHLSKLASAAFVGEDPTAVIIGRWK